MTPEQAGAALAADPTFALMSSLEREAEAAALLGGFGTPSDDPLDIALAVELASVAVLQAAQEITTTASTAGTEPCRLNGADGPPCGGAEPVAGNGRCMTCGAQRTVPEQASTGIAVDAPADIAIPITEPTRPARYADRIERNLSDLDATFIGRFKVATGATEKEVAGMMGVGRSTINAYVAGRLPERLSVSQGQALVDNLDERLILLSDLKRDILAAIGQF